MSTNIFTSRQNAKNYHQIIPLSRDQPHKDKQKTVGSANTRTLTTATNYWGNHGDQHSITGKQQMDCYCIYRNRSHSAGRTK